MGRYKRYLFTSEAVPVPERTSRRLRHEKQNLIQRKKKHLKNRKPALTPLGEPSIDINKTHDDISTQKISTCLNSPHPEMDILATPHGQEVIDQQHFMGDEGNNVSAADLKEINDTADKNKSDKESMDGVDQGQYLNDDGDNVSAANLEVINDSADSSESDQDLMGSIGEASCEIPSHTHFSNCPEVSTESDFDCAEKDLEMSGQLCSCTTTTVGEVLLMCLTLGLRHTLSWAAQMDILKMINVIFKKSVVPDTKFKFLRRVETDIENMLYHIFCPVCEMYLGKRADLSKIVTCLCGMTVNVPETSSFFLSVNLASQLNGILKDPKIVESLLTYRFQRKKLKEDALEDIYDGREYQNLFVNEGILSNPYNFSYCFNTDGIPLGKSSDKTIWPIYLTLNELPPKDRSKYTLLAGLYVGSKDPNQKIFLRPFVEEANKLSIDDFTWYFKGGEINSKLIPLCAIVDSQARWKLLNMSCFNAESGCTFCYQKTERSLKGRRFSVPTIRPEQRTEESTKRDISETIAKRNEKKPRDRIVRGVKRPTPLMPLEYFNLIRGFVPDYMHALFPGVIRLHIELILESTRKKFWVDMADNMGKEHLQTAIDERIKKIPPPKSISRLPRSLKDTKLWKASEWRSWLLFYFVPCLHGFLKRKHLFHQSLLSSASNLILQKSVRKEEVFEAHDFFMKYSILFQKYFGLEHMVYNVHLLSHIAQGVLSFGPAWTHNAFLYEGQNRHLLQLYQSPSHVTLQIVRKFLIYNNCLPMFCIKFTPSVETLRFCETIVSSTLKHFVRHKDIVFIGPGRNWVLSNEESLLLSEYNIIPPETLEFEKVIYQGTHFTIYNYALAKQ